MTQNKKQNKNYFISGVSYPADGGKKETVVCSYKCGEILWEPGATVCRAYNAKGDQIGGYFQSSGAAKIAIVKADGGAK